MKILILSAVFGIPAFILYCACRMDSQDFPCDGCSREDCTHCSYWKEMTHDDR